MYKRLFGIRRKMRFDSPEEYYETLGFLAKSDGSISLVWEHNEEQGAWGSEGRIHCHSNLDKFTAPLKRKFTKGRAKKVKHRINCNEFVEDITTNHGFQMGAVQNSGVIRNTIPNQYKSDFDKGFNL
ncbi:hypothetical protein [Carboxylicivirga sp. M1479]|uniref:hypothetical protein n=1 Tax=Carboxylicivirga sp. M1479 TaxID=2594476 RepID=UPI001177D3D1|nr:hypothetical protein [Carboxylicivirga sp. M1479]TRX70721.1 hypothetical protein FNN09_10635 [Carboxylicivirga sp. M1479]